MLITQFMTRVIRDTPGAPSELVRQALIEAASEFCETTRAWNEIQDAVLTINGVNDYEVDLPSNARPLAIERVWTSTNNELVPVTMERLQYLMPDWQTAVAAEPIFYNSEFDWDGFRIYPMPANVVGVKLRIKGSFQPTDTTDSLPDFLWYRYRTHIAAGAKSILQMMPALSGQLWANPQLAIVNRKIFEDGMAEAQIKRIQGGVSGRMVVQPRRFG